jgi:rod shape-determining protein MreD
VGVKSPIFSIDFIPMSIFFFTIFKETRPSKAFLICLGFVNDFLGGTTIGLSAVNYLLTYILAASNQKALDQQKFTVVWLTVAMVLVLIKCVDYASLYIINTVPSLPIAEFKSLCLDLTIYPLLHFCYYKKIHWFR